MKTTKLYRKHNVFALRNVIVMLIWRSVIFRQPAASGRAVCVSVILYGC